MFAETDENTCTCGGEAEASEVLTILLDKRQKALGGICNCLQRKAIMHEVRLPAICRSLIADRVYDNEFWRSWSTILLQLFVH